MVFGKGTLEDDMVKVHELHTERLLLRQWKASDSAAFAALNADPGVMRYFPALLGRAESDSMAARCSQFIREHGWGLWAAEELASGDFIGFIGLHRTAADLPCAPCVEVGWRLAERFWGRGLATEGARAALQFAFKQLDLAEVVSFTSIRNLRSEAVMQRLGMRRDPSTFAHPSIPAGHWLSEHCLYRATKPSAGGAAGR
jgi:RimJ/RimL family protein N-acetyltransferase